jgi:hypothetical protein
MFAVAEARAAGEAMIKSGVHCRSARNLAISGTTRFPRLFNGRSKSGMPATAQDDFACRMICNCFMVDFQSFRN